MTALGRARYSELEFNAPLDSAHAERLVASLRPLARASVVDRGDDFESRYLAGREAWPLQHPDAPDADEVRAEVDTHRNNWLHGYRGVLGFAYLTLVRSP